MKCPKCNKKITSKYVLKCFNCNNFVRVIGLAKKDTAYWIMLFILFLPIIPVSIYLLLKIIKPKELIFLCDTDIIIARPKLKLNIADIEEIDLVAGCKDEDKKLAGAATLMVNSPITIKLKGKEKHFTTSCSVIDAKGVIGTIKAEMAKIGLQASGIARKEPEKVFCKKDSSRQVIGFSGSLFVKNSVFLKGDSVIFAKGEQVIKLKDIECISFKYNAVHNRGIYMHDSPDGTISIIAGDVNNPYKQKNVSDIAEVGDKIIAEIKAQGLNPPRVMHHGRQTINPDVLYG